MQYNNKSAYLVANVKRCFPLFPYLFISIVSMVNGFNGICFCCYFVQVFSFCSCRKIIIYLESEAYRNIIPIEHDSIMPENLEKFLERQLKLIQEEKQRLKINENECKEHTDNDGNHQKDKVRLEHDEKENEPVRDCVVTQDTSKQDDKNVPLVEKLDLNSEKQASADNIVRSEQSVTFRSDDYSSRSAMLRYGEYSPNNPHLRVCAAPYLGVGEYEQRKKILKNKNQVEYKDNINNIQYTPTNLKTNTAEKDLSPSTIETHSSVMHNNRSPVLHRLDQRIAAAHNSLLKSEMDKPRGILTNRRTESPRERLLSDLKHTYVPSSSLMDGFNYTDRSEEAEREKIKREIYQNELRLQIEEKRRLAAMRDEQERKEQELENRRLEQQLLRMQEEQLRDEHRRKRREQVIRRNSDDFAVRKQEMQSRSYRKHLDSESSLSNLRSTNVASKLSHYSPPVSRRNHYSYNTPSSTSLYADQSSRYNPPMYDTLLRKDTLNRMDSLNVPSDNYNSYNYGRHNNSFSRYDSLSRIDSLKQQEALNRLETLSINDSLSRVQRRHSATQQDLSVLRRSPKLQRRSSSSRFDNTLPIPVLKAHSPVARELKNSIAVNSTRHSSDAVRKLEDKWQIPAVQKNVINHGDFYNGKSRSILTQLGSIRKQLQQEQLRMDETLRKRGILQSKSVDFQ